MLKGKTIIELTDVNTGKKEVHEDENMFTNALNEIFGVMPQLLDYEKIYNANSFNSSNEGYYRLYQRLLGGILLFDKALPEDVNQIFAPTDANLVGCGVYDKQNNTSGTVRGNFNQTESELNISQRYMKFVYDFTTSQANGEIASVCLTSQAGGYTTYGSSDAVFNSANKNGYELHRDFLQYTSSEKSTYLVGAKAVDATFDCNMTGVDYIIALSPEFDTVFYFSLLDDKTGIKIVKRKMYIKEFSLLDNVYQKKELLETKDISIGSDFKNNLYSATYNFDTSDNCLYIVHSSNSSIASNGKIYIEKISLEDYTVETFIVTNTTSTALTAPNARIWKCFNGYVYGVPYNSSISATYRFKINNSADVKEIKTKDGDSITLYPKYCINGRVYCANGYVITEDGVALKTECKICDIITKNAEGYICITPVIGHEIFRHVSNVSDNYTSKFATIGNYLATINNLSQPVTKTADKTMKVTYVIQETT